MFKEDIKQLRSALTSHIGSINILLVTQAVASISIAEEDREHHVSSLEQKILTHQRLLEDVNDRVSTSLAQQRHIQTQLESQGAVLDALENNADSTCTQLSNQAASIQNIQTTTMHNQQQTKSVLGMVTEILRLVTSGILHIRQLAQQLQLMLRLYSTFTTEMRRTMGKAMEVFVNVQTLLQRLDSRIPARLYLPIVQFTTALGDTIALPHQLCQQWTTFTELLKVAFMDKPGQHRVQMGMYSTMNTCGGRILKKDTWQNAVLPDDHLSMSIILDDITESAGTCPYPTCKGAIEDCERESSGLRCRSCGRWFLLEQQPLLSATSSMEPAARVSEMNAAIDNTYNQRLDDTEDVEVYRRIHVQLRRSETLKDPFLDTSTAPETLALGDSGSGLRSYGGGGWASGGAGGLWGCAECGAPNPEWYDMCTDCGSIR